MSVGGPSPSVGGDSKLGHDNKGHQLLMKMGISKYPTNFDPLSCNI